MFESVTSTCLTRVWCHVSHTSHICARGPSATRRSLPSSSALSSPPPSTATQSRHAPFSHPEMPRTTRRAPPLLLLLLLPATALRLGATTVRRRSLLCALPALSACRPYAAAAKESLADVYDAQAATYDSSYDQSAIGRVVDFDGLRAGLMSKAKGDVLELGVGTGLNLPWYDPGRVRSVTGVDVSNGMLEIARERSQTLRLKREKVTLRVADAAALPFEDGSFDVVTDTFGLCVFQKPSFVLTEARRVLRPGGKLLMVEHEDSPVSRALSFTRASSPIAATCAYDQDVRALVKASGMRIVETSSVAGGFFRVVMAEKP